MKVACSISETELENDNGYDVDSVCATCSRCGHGTVSYGTSRASINRCLVLMREGCPNNENNFYVNEDDIED